MQPRLSSQRNAGVTLFEVFILVAVIMILAAVTLAVLIRKTHHGSNRLTCVNNLEQIGLSFRVWSGDNNDKYPMGVSVTNGGSLEMAASGDVVRTFLVMSNELGTTKILACPVDANRSASVDFTHLTNTNISYFIGVDGPNDNNPQMILSGDSNLESNAVPIASGLNVFRAHDPLTWSAACHIHKGNIGLADGNAEEPDDTRLLKILSLSGIATNRFATP